MPVPKVADSRRASPRDRINVLLVDDHEVLVEALAGAIERRDDLTVVGCAGSVRELEENHWARPDVAIVDYLLPDGTGADACRHIRARWPGARILILSGLDHDEEAVLSSLRAGADGFLSKHQPLAALVGAVRDVAAGTPVVEPEVLGRLARSLRSRPETPARPVLREPLTPRELAVLRELVLGHSTHTIATNLQIADGTVRRHVEAIRGKFGVSTRLEAVSEALRHHIVELASAGS